MLAVCCFLREGGVYERGTAEIASGQARLAVWSTKQSSGNFSHSNKLLPKCLRKTWFTIPFGLAPRHARFLPEEAQT